MDITEQLDALAASDDAATLIAHRFVIARAAEEIRALRSGSGTPVAPSGTGLSPEVTMMLEQAAVLWPMIKGWLVPQEKPAETTWGQPTIVSLNGKGEA